MNKELNRIDLHEKIDKIFDFNTPLTVIIHLDGMGGYKLESKLGHKAMMQEGCLEAISKIITDKKD